MVKLTTIYRQDRKFYGYRFRGRIYRTKMGLNHAFKVFMRKNPNRTQTPAAIPVYRII